jgi:hypothetical protein
MSKISENTTVTLLDAVSASGAGDAFEFGTRGPRAMEGIVQVIIGGTATVQIEGSLDGSNWFDIAEFTSSGASAITAPRYIRGNVTSHSSGDVTAYFELPAGWFVE